LVIIYANLVASHYQASIGDIVAKLANTAIGDYFNRGVIDLEGR